MLRGSRLTSTARAPEVRSQLRGQSRGPGPWSSAWSVLAAKVAMTDPEHVVPPLRQVSEVRDPLHAHPLGGGRGPRLSGCTIANTSVTPPSWIAHRASAEPASAAYPRPHAPGTSAQPMARLSPPGGTYSRESAPTTSAPPRVTTAQCPTQSEVEAASCCHWDDVRAHRSHAGDPRGGRPQPSSDRRCVEDRERLRGVRRLPRPQVEPLGLDCPRHGHTSHLSGC